MPLLLPTTIKECELCHDMIGLFYTLWVPEYEKRIKNDGQIHSRQEAVNQFMSCYYKNLEGRDDD